MSDRKKQQNKLLVKVRQILFGLCLVVGVGIGVVYAAATDNTSSQESKKLQNGSFEEGQTWTSPYLQPDQSKVPSWNTTAFQGKIELDFFQEIGFIQCGYVFGESDGAFCGHALAFV